MRSSQWPGKLNAIIPGVGDKKVANGVVALSSAAVLAIYGVGYARTRAAADRFTQQAAERHPRTPPTGGEREAIALGVADAPVPTADTSVNEPPRAPETVTADAAAPAAAPASARGEGDAPVAPGKTQPVQADVTATKTSPAATVADVEEAPAPAPAALPEATTTSAQADANSPTVPPVPAPVTPAEPAKAGYKDGTYYGWGTCRHGDIQAAVVIESGRITAARVEKCLTRYSCNWVDPIPPRILLKQGTTYDYVSGATESSDAFQDAVAEALSQAK